MNEMQRWTPGGWTPSGEEEFISLSGSSGGSAVLSSNTDVSGFSPGQFLYSTGTKLAASAITVSSIGALPVSGGEMTGTLTAAALGTAAAAYKTEAVRNTVVLKATDSPGSYKEGTVILTVN